MDETQALRVLGLQEGVSRQAIDKRYRKLMLKLHPDKQPNKPIDDASCAQLHQLQQACKCLRDALDGTKASERQLDAADKAAAEQSQENIDRMFAEAGSAAPTPDAGLPQGLPELLLALQQRCSDEYSVSLVVDELPVQPAAPAAVTSDAELVKELCQLSNTLPQHIIRSALSQHVLDQCRKCGRFVACKVLVTDRVSCDCPPAARRKRTAPSHQAEVVTAQEDDSSAAVESLVLEVLKRDRCAMHYEHIQKRIGQLALRSPPPATNTVLHAAKSMASKGQLHSDASQRSKTFFLPEDAQADITKQGCPQKRMRLEPGQTIQRVREVLARCGCPLHPADIHYEMEFARLSDMPTFSAVQRACQRDVRDPEPTLGVEEIVGPPRKKLYYLLSTDDQQDDAGLQATNADAAPEAMDADATPEAIWADVTPVAMDAAAPEASEDDTAKSELIDASCLLASRMSRNVM